MVFDSMFVLYHLIYPVLRLVGMFSCYFITWMYGLSLQEGQYVECTQMVFHVI